MTAKAVAAFTCAGVLVLGTAALPRAQERTGARPLETTGSVERIVVHGVALEGNREAGSPDREVTVYLPPGYATDQTRRYPVVYLLHGNGVRVDAFIAQFGLQESGDRLSTAQGFSASIVVTPNALTPRGDTMYAGSFAAGWERFVAEDLVAAIDARYRTIASRISRGLAGYSTGGYGAVRIGVKRPDVFSSLYLMSAGPLDGLSESADVQLESLKGLYAVGIDVGTGDMLLAANRQLHQTLTRLRIPHSYEEYDGDHTSRVRERIERGLLPFFSRNLAAPANPTSPSVK